MRKVLFWGTYAQCLKRQIPLQNKETCTFYFETDEKQEYYDVIAVLEKLEKNFLGKARDTYFFSGEPEAISTPDSKFLKQFDVIVTTNNSINTKASIIKKQFLNWHIGLFSDPLKYNYDFFSTTNYFNSKKHNTIVGISGKKSLIEGHNNRYNFMNVCKEYFNDGFDIYGRGIRDFNDKIDFLPNYKYQVVIENCQSEHYYTEKLCDSFLAECYTFYFGCPNIKDYFPENSLTVIDISNPEQALKQIHEAIANNYFEKYYDDILISKHKVLNDHNIIQFLETVKSTNSIKKIKLTNKSSYSVNIILRLVKRIIKAVIRRK